MPEDIAREQIDELMILGHDIRMALDLEERIKAGDVELIGFADGERIMVSIPPEQIGQLKAKRQQLQALLKQKAVKI